jgi:hypothetical protein
MRPAAWAPRHDQIDLGHHVASRGRVLAVLGGDAAQGQAGMRQQAVADAQPRSAGLAIDEHARLGSHLNLRPRRPKPTSDHNA